MTISSEQYEILSRYGAGMAPDEIAKHTGIDADDVLQTVSLLTNLNRQRAGALAREYADARRNKRLTAVPAPVNPAPASPAPVSTTPASPAPAGQTIEQLLDAAELTEVPRLVKAAGRIRALVGELDAAVREAEQERALRERIEKLRAELDEAAGELRELTGKPARPATPRAAEPAAGGPSAREIRAWAKANGVECNAIGIIPQRVRDAYAAAHQGGEAA